MSLLGLVATLYASLKENSHSLPRIADPLIAARPCSKVVVLAHDLLRELSLLGLILVMENEDGERGLLVLTSSLALGLLDILLEFAHRILERSPCIIDLVNNKHILADQVCHLETAQIQPLCAGDLRSGRFDGIVSEGFVERQADGLNGDVGGARLLEERAT